jgi:hypothetical protein
MEPSGRKWSQSAANQRAAETAKASETVTVDRHWLPATFHGKELVNGSSPSAGL